MKEIQINKQTEDTKLLRMLFKLLPKADKNFIYKMLRKKNITLNDKKASGNELLKSGDCIRVYFSDETYEKFSAGEESEKEKQRNSESYIPSLDRTGIIFEDKDILLVNKPTGVLSQKASENDISMVEIIARYLEEKGEYDPGASAGFKPAVANRLDRNTSGIIAAGKTVSGLKLLSEGFKKKTIEKLYLCPVKGELAKEALLKGLWEKRGHGNKVIIREIDDICPSSPETTSTHPPYFPRELFVKGNVPVLTYVNPIRSNGKTTLCMVRLMTGKTHQIRAHLAATGHPLLGDYKYGDKSYNDYYKKSYGTEFQLLHAYCLKIPEKGVFFADIPEGFKALLNGEDLWVHGIQEVFEDQLSRI